MAGEDDSDDDYVATDGTPDPVAEPKSARAWWALIEQAERVFDPYQSACDNVDRFYANLERLRASVREREMQLFWANMQVLGPSIYSRPPNPVVVPAFKDKRPLNRTAAEVLERGLVTTCRAQDIDGVMRLLRDDMMRLSRGAPWLRFEDEDGEQCVCIDWKYRRDFLHDPARTWAEVDWVAGAAYLSKREMRKRFKSTSNDEYRKAAYAVVKDDNNGKFGDQVKAKVWELWSKSANRVVWIAEGCEKLLDDGKPHLDLEGFFPCPRPAYDVLQPGTLIPIPTFLFWKDQAEEINELTGRIGALSGALKLKGFYPAGAGEIGDAIEAAIKDTNNNAVLIPVSNWAMLGGSAKDTIVWLPLNDIVQAITACVELRKQLIDDVYQITGLSDIMRGDTEPSETLGAQQLKSQYGSVRVHDKQQELVRVARDIVRIAGEIISEDFSQQSIADLSQMDLPTDAEIAAKVKPLKAQLAQINAEVAQAEQNPRLQQIAQQNPDQAKQIVAQVQQQAQGIQSQIEQLDGTVTINAVVKFLRDNRMRPFTLDIETDSTIEPDEAAQQARAAQFVEAVGQFMGQAIPLVEQIPQAAPVAAAMLKFVASQYRVGREIEGIIDEFADNMAEIAQQPKGPSPEAQKAQADAQATQASNQLAQLKLQLEGKAQQTQAQLDAANLQLQQKNQELEMQKAQFQAQLASKQLQLDQAKATSDAQVAQTKNDNEAIKHHSIEETKRQGQALSSLTAIEVAKINNGGSLQQAAIEASLEQIADVGQQTHEMNLQQTQHEHELELADSQAQAQAAAAEQGGGNE